MKIWVIACSANGYTYDYAVYLGKGAAKSLYGLGYDVTMNLCKSLFGQGYKLFTDNFYTSAVL